MNEQNITPWIKATASDNGAGCVELRRNGAHLQVRDSKLGDESPVLTFNRSEINAFLDGLSKDEFGHLLAD